MPDTLLLPDLIAALPLPTLAINRNERIVAVNDAATELIGAGILGRHFVTALRQPTLVDAVEGTLADGQARVAQFLTGDVGQDSTFEVTVKAVAGTGSVILSFQDVTHKAQAGQMRRDFVANVSHELRTPLTALIGFIETLAGPARDDATARDRFLKIMAGEAGRMNRLVSDLLSLSRVEAEERVRPTQQVDLAEIMGTTLHMLAQLAEERDVTLNVDLGDGSLLLRGDEDQLTQVFTNLVENAIKYGGQGKTVDIKAEISLRDPALRGPSVRVHVRDFGPGIDPIHVPRVTERFYRVDSHRSRSLGGTGLGLAIVKHILNRHRGRLKISSKLNEGATFTVILPLDMVDR